MNKVYLFLIISIGIFSLISCGDNVVFTNTDERDAVQDSILAASDGVEIAYSMKGEGPLTLVFIHGWCIDQTYWEEQISIFSTNYKTVAFDLPGFGKSGKDRKLYSIEQYATDVNTLVKTLNLQNVVLIGHSMAGDIILEAAHENNGIKALVGVENFKDVNEELSEEMQGQIDRFMTLIQDQYIEIATAYANESLFSSQTDSIIKSRVLNDIQSADPHISTSCLQAIFDYAPREKERLATLDKKLYLINSAYTETKTKPLDYMGVDYKLLEIPGTGHFPMTENPRGFNFKLQEVLDQLSPEE